MLWRLTEAGLPGCCRAQVSASSMSSSTSSSDFESFCRLMSWTVISKMRSCTASATNLERSPLRPPPLLARCYRRDLSISAETTRFQRIVVEAMGMLLDCDLFQYTDMQINTYVGKLGGRN